MIRLGITLGDPVGVGPEILIKALPQLEKVKAQFLIFGDKNLLFSLADTYKISFPQNVEILSISDLKITPGFPTKDTHKATLNYLFRAIDYLKKDQLKGLITLPINKEAFKVLELPYRGHTEFLAESFGVKKFAMTFYGKKLKVALATTHIPLIEVPFKIEEEKIVARVELIYEFLRKIKRKKEEIKIALCALNPHAGEGGLLGDEEITSLKPIVEGLQKQGIPLYGPYPADSLFYRASKGEFDFVVALYHDQGLIPFKLLHFRDGVNLTLGLPFVRTSPVHGTAYDIAGKGIADPTSFVSAVKLAVKLARKW